MLYPLFNREHYNYCMGPNEIRKRFERKIVNLLLPTCMYQFKRVLAD